MTLGAFFFLVLLLLGFHVVSRLSAHDGPLIERVKQQHKAEW